MQTTTTTTLPGTLAPVSRRARNRAALLDGATLRRHEPATSGSWPDEIDHEPLTPVDRRARNRSDRHAVALALRTLSL